jgi:hypothetical protein
MPLRRVTVNVVVRQTRLAARDSSARTRKICAVYKDKNVKSMGDHSRSLWVEDISTNRDRSVF